MKIVTRILATALFLPVITYSSRADVLALWNFDGSTITLPPSPQPSLTGVAADSGINMASASAASVHASNSTFTTVAGNGSAKSFSSNTWAIGDYYQFSISTVGFQDITLEWDQTSSGTGPREFNLTYSTNGTDYTVFNPYNVLQNDASNGGVWSTGGSRFSNYTNIFDLSTITGLNNNATVSFRLVMASTVSANGGSVAGAGTNRVDNFSINGVTFGTADAYWDTNGSTAGTGGAGTWTGSSNTWNPLADGTGAVTTLGATGKAVFQGNAGAPVTVTVGAGANASNGLYFNTNGYTLAGGTLSLGGTGPRIQVTNAADTTTISAVLTNTTAGSGLRKTGAGTLILTGTNTYTGPTTIEGGALQIASEAALGSGVANLVLNGGTLKLTNDLTLSANRPLTGTGSLDIPAGKKLTLNGTTAAGALTLLNLGTLMLAGSTPSVGGLAFTQASVVNVASLNTLSVNGTIATTHVTGMAEISGPGTLDFGNGARTISVKRGDHPTADLRISANSISSGSVTTYITKSGTGILDFTGNNSFSGGFQMGFSGTTPETGGTVIIHDITPLGSPASTFRFNAGVIRNSSGTPLQFNNGVSFASQLEGAIFEGASFEFLGASNIFRAGTASTTYQHKITANTDVIFSGAFNEGTSPGVGITTGLTFTGTGRVFITATSNTLSVPNMVVDGGKLYVAGNMTTRPPVFVHSGGVLGGDLTVSGNLTDSVGNLTVNNGGTLAPGLPIDLISAGYVTDSTSTFKTLNLNIENAGLYIVDIAGAVDGSYDKVQVTGTVTLGGGLQLTSVPGSLTIGDQLMIIENDGTDAVVGTFAAIPDEFEIYTATHAFRVDYNGGTGNDVVLIVVPEPGSAALLLGGLGLCAVGWRRRKG